MQSASLENAVLRIESKARGAELTSLFLKNEAEEWLWQADPTYWGKHAPILFPVIGCVKQGRYIMNEQVYSMTKHGFARDYDFKLIEQNDNEIIWRFTGNEETYAMYPFQYDLEVGYKLENRSLIVTYELLNRSEEETMWFSIGGHPAFNVNLAEASWSLVFEKPEALESLQVDLKSGLILPQKISLASEKTQTLALHPGLFREDALIFENLESSYVQLVKGEGDVKLTFDRGQFPLLAFWTPIYGDAANQESSAELNGAPFLCIEPWFGLADLIDSDGDISNKKGIQLLGPNAKFTCSYTMTL